MWQIVAEPGRQFSAKSCLGRTLLTYLALFWENGGNQYKKMVKRFFWPIQAKNFKFKPSEAGQRWGSDRKICMVPTLLNALTSSLNLYWLKPWFYCILESVKIQSFERQKKTETFYHTDKFSSINLKKKSSRKKRCGTRSNESLKFIRLAK